MFVSEDIEKARDHALGLYQDYLHLRGDVNDHVDLDHLADQMQRVRDLSVLLVVAGEVNSGKSSFVNALLGTDLLPVDTLQASSAVVEIDHGDERLLEVTYADDHVERIGEEGGDWRRRATDLLGRVAAVPDAFRDLPIVQLRQLAARQASSLLGRRIAALAAEPATNPRRLPPAEFADRAHAFLADHGDPSQVAVRVRIRHPLPHQSDAVTVVDTPGVDAVGGVESVTRDYLSQADALLFVKAFSTSVESRSFRDFVEQNVRDKLKESLFLILTQASRLSHSDQAARVDEAHRNFDRVVGSPERVLAVDSVMESARADAADFASADDLLDHYDEAAATGSRLAEEKARLLSPLARREKDFACLRDKIDDAAGFTPVHHALQTFAANAPKIQIAQALDSLLVGLSNLSGYHREKAELNLQGAEDPDELRAELERRQEEIDSLKNAVQKSKKSITTEFLDAVDGSAVHDIEAKKTTGGTALTKRAPPRR